VTSTRTLQRALYMAVAAALVFLSGCQRARPAVTPPGPVVVAIITWNTHLGHGDLPRLVDDVESGRLTGAPVRTYALLLQEVNEKGQRDVTEVARAHNLSTFVSRIRLKTRLTGNAILATMPLIEARELELPQAREPRRAIITTLEIDGERLFLACTHLENRTALWRAGGMFSDIARGRQADALLRALPDVPHGIVGGDLNTWLGPNEAAWRALSRRFPDADRVREEPTFYDRLILDHLFFDLPARWIVTRRVIPNLYGSDHHPLLGLITTLGHAGFG
jgi:endonuclease/exonuclease/phosphatase family metal-dependent hydrolase